VDSPEIEAFLTHLAVQRRMAASNQNQALSALVFLYHHVLHQDMGGQIDTVPAKQSRYLPTCWHRLRRLLELLNFRRVHQRVAKLLFGSGHVYPKLCDCG
jgi:hypothetical protein